MSSLEVTDLSVRFGGHLAVGGVSLRVDGGLHNNARSNFYEVPDHERSTPFNGFPLYRVPDVLKR